ncbi:MAG: hypothetical protein WBB85_11275, partial [Albidovulum sp.]|uniref:hypothetical protein n=1 Tax=Albidovulum sp. TaxID=1872424 RepID=UPI003CBCDC30
MRIGMIAGAALLALVGAAALAFPREARLVLQVVGAEIVTPAPPEAPRKAATPEAMRLIAAAEG